MRPNDLLILNLEETRRRSRTIWSAIPPDRAHWRPDPDAMSSVEMVRHVVESSYVYALMLRSGGSVDDDASPLAGLPLASVEEEVARGEPLLRELLETVAAFTLDELRERTVNRPDRGYVRSVGDFALRVAYHEAVHAGQMLGYLRAMGVERPSVWD